MALVAFTGTITAATLRSNFDDKTATLTTQARAGIKDQTRFMRLESVDNTVDVSLRSFAWTQPDDQELRIIYCSKQASVAGTPLTATLTVDGTDQTFLLGATVTASTSGVGVGADDSRTNSQRDFRTVTGTRIRLLRGVRYRLTASTTTANAHTGVIFGIQLRTDRRRS